MAYIIYNKKTGITLKTKYQINTRTFETKGAAKAYRTRQAKQKKQLISNLQTMQSCAKQTRRLIMMSEKEKEDFKKANEVVHPVETQWHYETMMKYGYQAITKTGIGFVRGYEYVHPVTGHKMVLTTGYSADYFTDYSPIEGIETRTNYWSDLAPYLEKIKQHFESK